MEKNDLLYTVRGWYENERKTGIVLILTAKDRGGKYHTIKAYVPYRSQFEDAPKAEKFLKVNGHGETAARITVFKEKKFDE